MKLPNRAIKSGVFPADAGVGLVMVVVTQPVLVGASAFGLVQVRLRVGPFTGRGAIKPLDFPVGLG